MNALLFPIELFASSLSLIKKLNRLNGSVKPSVFLSTMSQSEILCGICLDSLNSNTAEILLTCQHRFHDDCVEPWLAHKGTCPTCRALIREVEESDDELNDVTAQTIFENIESIREFVMNYWQQRTPEMDLQAIVQQVQEEREAREAERQAQTGIRLEEYAAHVRIVQETDQEWLYEVDGQPGRSLKNDVALVQMQTEAGFLTCIYAMHIYENDIVNSIMDITGV